MISRRTILTGTGALSAIAVAGCTTYGTVPNTNPGAGKPAVLGPVTDIPVGGGKIFEAQKVVVTQPTQGQIKCFSAICTHLGCIVGQVSGGTINCPCHGSEFHITDGSVARGPATRPLGPKKITIAGGVVSLD
jgi:Rieske Fe-S protein